HVVNVAHQLVEPDRHSEQLELIPRRPNRSERRGDVHIQGVGNLLTQLAGCCQPVPGDPLIGYINVGRGVTVHRPDGATVPQLLANEKINVLEASSRTNPDDNYASMMLTLEIPNLHLLSRLLTRIGQLPNVIEARRNRQERRA